jgi:hypothetical protein
MSSSTWVIERTFFLSASSTIMLSARAPSEEPQEWEADRDRSSQESGLMESRYACSRRKADAE